MALAGRVIIYGGRGALGTECVSRFKKNDFWVASVGMRENVEADVNILVDKDDSLERQEARVLESVQVALDEAKLDAVICVAGGWAGGNATKDLAKTSELMWRQSVWSSVIAASLAAGHLKEGGLLTLSGAGSALEGTPKMLGYGLAKAAVHHLAKSLARDGSGMPPSSLTVAILPDTLDTPSNRKAMPKADFSSWTPLAFISNTFLDWTRGTNRPNNGSLVRVVTRDSATEMVPLDSRSRDAEMYLSQGIL